MRIKNTILLFIFFFAIAIPYGLETKKSRSFNLFFTKHYQPFIKAQIGNINEAFLLDSGGSCCCLLSEATLNQFPQKKWVRDLTLMSFKGDLNSHPEYLIKGSKIFNIHFNNLLISQLPANSLDCSTGLGWYNSSIEYQIQPATDPITAHVGHVLLNGMNCLFDFKNNIFKTFNRGYLPLFSFPYGNFIKSNQIAFEYDRCKGLFSYIETEYGLKKFMIDTGTTLTILNKKSFPDIPFYQKEETYLPEVYFKKFKIGLIDYGSKQAFIENELQMDYLDGILGMDFFYGKKIFFDMENQIMYLD